jgi:hypothetical protein
LALDQICDGKNQIGIAQMEGKMFLPPFFRAFELYDHLSLSSFFSLPSSFVVIKFGGFTSFVYGHGETHPITFARRVHVRSSLFNGDCQLSLRLMNDTLSMSVARERYLDVNNFKVSFHLCDTFKVSFHTHGPPTFILHAKGYALHLRSC